MKTLRAIAAGSAGGFGPYVRREDMERVLAMHDGSSPLGLFLRLLWQSGARISEVLGDPTLKPPALGLRVSDIDFGGRTLRLQTLKRRKGDDGTSPQRFRLVPIGDDLLGFLGQHIGYVRPSPGDKLFGWGRRHATRLVTEALLAGGVPREQAHPHAIRHGHAVAAILAGVPLPALQKQLDHASIATTAIYLDLTIEDRKAAYRGVF